MAAVQESVLNAMESAFSDDFPVIEAAILAPGLEGWESRAIQMLKARVAEDFGALQAHAAAVNLRYRSAIPAKDQPEYWVDPKNQPHLRVYWCLKCGYKVTSMSLSGICCHGQPECPRCQHQVHEDTCRRKMTGATGPAPEAP